jgi:peptide deformylase
MTIRPILRAGAAILSEVARPLAAADMPSLPQLVADMLASMAAAGGTGLAAPQIGESVRLVIFEVSAARTTAQPDDDPIGMTVLVNPSWQVLDATEDLGWEGCLSLPGLRGEVPRYRRIRYSGHDLNGTRIERTAAGFHARVFQHEVDHLDGILYPQRMRDMRRFGFTEEILATAATIGDR